MAEKPIRIVRHAAERFLERNIPLGMIKKMLEKGVKIPDVELDRMLCIYKARGEFYTLVYEEDEHEITVITGYKSGGWEMGQFERVKKLEKHKKRS